MGVGVKLAPGVDVTLGVGVLVGVLVGVFRWCISWV